MKIAVEGCAHGDLDNIYATVQHLERTENTKIDLLICCGDFQAVRNQDDLESLACPVKYRSMNSFWKYYSGQKVAPYPTVFVGGNHEASNYLWELYYGGWVAKNIYFLGFAGVINFGGIRIGGLSGIYKPHDYHSGHYERAPYNGHDIRSVYHVRSYDVLKLMQIEESLDVFISHDWPRGITKFGNKQELLRKKPFFEKEVEANTLGSVPAEQLLHKLRPSYWFSAHLHTKFAALVQHPGGTTSTKFLALDKCLPKRQFLQVVEFPEATGALEFTFDEEWLSITRAFDPYFPLTRRRSSNQFANLITKDELRMHREWVQHALQVHGKAIPLEFAITAPPYNPSDARIRRAQQKAHFRNQHTEQFLKLLALPYKLDAPEEAGYEDPGGNFMVPGKVVEDPNEIQLAEDGALDDPNEVPLDDSDTER